MRKKAQLTFFVVLGIFILFIFIFLFWVLQSSQKSQLEKEQESKLDIPLKLNLIKTSISSCLEMSGKDVLYYAGRQGGYIFPEQRFSNNVNIDIYKVPYYIDCGRQTYPDINQIKQETERLIYQEFLDCFQIQIQSSLRQQGLFLNDAPNVGKVNVSFNAEDTVVDLYYPLDVLSKEFTGEISLFRQRLNIPFLKFYNFTNNFIQDMSQQSVINSMLDYGPYIVNSNCNRYQQDKTNLFIKKLCNETDLIQLVDYKSYNTYSKSFVYQFTTRKMKFTGSQCLSVTDNDQDGVAEDLDKLSNTFDSMVDPAGLDCNQKSCGFGKSCIYFKQSAVCLNNTDISTSRVFYSNLKSKAIGSITFGGVTTNILTDKWACPLCLKVLTGQGVVPTLCTGLESGGFCNGGYYTDLTFDHPFARTPNVMVFIEDASIQSPSCVGHTVDRISCVPGYISKTGFRMYCDSSPSSLATQCGINEAKSVHSSARWIAIGY